MTGTRPPERGLLLVAMLALGSLFVVGAGPGAAQTDVERLGARHGTLPPAGYFRTLERIPDAFRFRRGWQARNPRLDVDAAARLRALPEVTDFPGEGLSGDTGRTPGSTRFPIPSSGAAGAGGVPAGATALGLGPRPSGVTGTLEFPLVLAYFADRTEAPGWDSEAVRTHYLDGPNPRGPSVSEFYDQMSGGRLELRGTALPWTRSWLSRAQVSGQNAGLDVFVSRTGQFIESALDSLDDGSIDWGRFDNDGPDGIPNSGDDDGFVDVLAVMHPDGGAECDGSPDRIWSHRWALSRWLGSPYETSSPSANGGPVRVEDYTIQPLLNCAGDDIGEVGVFAHELGHGLGLPDLYCTGLGCTAAGIGEWGLMGSGSWGCDGESPARPCPMSAWSRLVLGWAQLEDLPPAAELEAVTLPPVSSSDRILRYRIPGTSEYYLLENRQPDAAGTALHASGLLVWHVDDQVVTDGWAANRVNARPSRFGVALVQADGLDDLSTEDTNRGDGGDPFPGSTGRVAFHAGTVPGARARDGLAAGFTLTDLVPAGPDLVFDLVTGFRTLTVGTEGDGGLGSLVEVDGAALPAGGGAVPAAPFEALDIRAAAGEVVSAGVRTPFSGWADGVGNARREVTMGLADTTLTARYQGRELQVGVTLTGGEYGVPPGVVEGDPASAGLWYAEGTAVTLTARANPGFSFGGWTDALAGAPNPVGLVVDEPVAAGAAFDYVFAAADLDPVRLAAGDVLALSLTAEGGQDPVAWTLEEGLLPAGVALDGARIGGAPLETGSFTLTVRATDAQGLQGVARFVLQVLEPQLELATVAGELLGNGRAATPGQVAYLDRSGNGNGRLDLGDIRRYRGRLQSGAAAVAPAPGAVHVELPEVPVRIRPMAPVKGGGS